MAVPTDPIKHAAYCKNMSAVTMGRKKTEDHCRHISEGNKGKPKAEEHRKNISIAKTGKPSNRKGAVLSEETKEKLRRSAAWMRDPANKKKRDAMYLKRSQNPEWIANHDATSKRISQDPEWRKNHKSAMRIRAKNYEWRLKNVESHIGGFWIGNVRYYDGPQYCEKFNPDFKQRCRAYWNYTCVKCGKHESQHITKRGQRRNLTVHHVHYDKKMCCNGSPRDVVTLCLSCNIKVNTNRNHWEKYFTDIIYGQSPSGKCYFEPEEMDEE